MKNYLIEWSFYDLINRSDSLIESIKSYDKFYVYRIYNIDDNRSYIGTTKNVYERLYNKFHGHVTSKDRNHCDFIHKNMKLIGFNKFKFQLLYESDDINEILSKESYFIELYDSYNNGFNRNNTGKIGPGIGSVSMYNPVSKIYSRIKPNEVDEYLSDGWIRKSPNKGTRQMVSPDGVFCQVPEGISDSLLSEGYKYTSFTKDTSWVFIYDDNDYFMVSKEIASDLVSKNLAKYESPSKGLVNVYKGNINIRVPKDQLQIYLSEGFSRGNNKLKNKIQIYNESENVCIRINKYELDDYINLGWRLGGRNRVMMYNPDTGRQLNVTDPNRANYLLNNGFKRGLCRYNGIVFMNNGVDTIKVNPNEVSLYKDKGYNKFGKL